MKKWLGGIFSAVVVAVIATWLAGFLNQVVPWGPARVRLAIRNLFPGNLERQEDGFRIVLCWLQDDGSGTDTRQVEDAFSGVRGIKLVRSARVVAASGASDDWRKSMKANAHRVLEDWNADLAIAGLVKKSGEVLSLWFVPRSGDGTLGRGDRPYRLDDVTLGADFHEDLRAELTSVALTAVAPLAGSEAQGRVLVRGLEEATERLAILLDGRTIGRAGRHSALQMAHGNALVVLGERESGPERLKQALEAYRAALEIRTRERTPLDWAWIQNNRGVALRSLADREGDTERLKQALEAYRAALEIRTRERMPVDWATTQNNLGSALWTLGKREGNTERLAQAVDAFRAALEIRTRERLPLVWAQTQNNLGNVLLALGERESGTEHLAQAVDAYLAALREFTREHEPRNWAATQNNLGTALASLGKRESGTQRIEQAVNAYRAALEIRTREHLPLDWAQTQINVGNALSTLGRRERGTEHLEQAEDAYRGALEVLAREDMPVDWATTQNNLGIVLFILDERENGTERLWQGGRGLSCGAGDTHPRAHACRLGHDPEQPWQRSPDSGQAQARERADRAGHRGLSRGARDTHPRAHACRLGHDAEQPRQRSRSARRVGERYRAS